MISGYEEKAVGDFRRNEFTMDYIKRNAAIFTITQYLIKYAEEASKDDFVVYDFDEAICYFSTQIPANNNCLSVPIMDFIWEHLLVIVSKHNYEDNYALYITPSLEDVYHFLDYRYTSYMLSKIS